MKRVYLSDTIAKKIKSYIRDNGMTEGEKLPAVSEWMEKLEVGRSTLREGLKKLETEDIIEIKNGKGMFVKKINPFRIYTSFHVCDAKTHLLEVLDVRTPLEAKAIELAVDHINEGQLQEMERHLANYSDYRNAGDLQMASKSDSEFHRVIYKASNNQILFEIITTLHKELYVLWDTPFNKGELYDEGYPYHVELLNGLKQKDKEKSLSSFYALINSVRGNILKLGEHW